MFILWIRKSDKNKKGKELSGSENIKAHDEEMKRFRATHQRIDIVPARDIVTADGDLLAVISTVRLSPNVFN